MRPSLAILLLLAVAAGASVANAPPDSGDAAAARVETVLSGPAAEAAAVAEAERAFARTMAERDARAFADFLHPDTVWFSGPGGSALHGREAVMAAWGRFFEGPKAPFSWAPDRVAVMADGQLAMSMGPVFDPEGRPTARFSSVWRRDADGRWRVLFDKGEPLAPPAASP
jgi:uncharacterized protein (TIGR02246 family)